MNQKKKTKFRPLCLQGRVLRFLSTAGLWVPVVKEECLQRPGSRAPAGLVWSPREGPSEEAAGRPGAGRLDPAQTSPVRRPLREEASPAEQPTSRSLLPWLCCLASDRWCPAWDRAGGRPVPPPGAPGQLPRQAFSLLFPGLSFFFFKFKNT